MVPSLQVQKELLMSTSLSSKAALILPVAPVRLFPPSQVEPSAKMGLVSLFLKAALPDLHYESQDDMIYIDNYMHCPGKAFGVFGTTKSKSTSTFEVGDTFWIPIEGEIYPFEVLDREPFQRDPQSDHWLVKVDMSQAAHIDLEKLRVFRGMCNVVRG